MKRLLIVLLLLNACIIYADSSELTINVNVSNDYTNYLNNKLSYYNNIIDTTTNSTAKMSARANRVIVNLALAECDLVNFPADNKFLIDSLINCNAQIDKFYKSNLEPLNPGSDNDFVNDFLELFKEPKYSALKNDINNIAQRYRNNTSRFAKSTGEMISGLCNRINQIEDDLNILENNTVQFEFSVRFILPDSSKTVQFTDKMFRNLKTIKDGLPQFLMGIKEELLHIRNGIVSLFNNPYVTPYYCLDSLRTDVKIINSFMYFFAEIFSQNELIKTGVDSAGINNAKKYLTEADTLLGGKVYTFGSNNLKIKPAALLKYSDNLLKICLDFYRAPNKYTYTFDGLFPYGLPAASVNQLKEDLVINTTDNSDKMYSRIQQQKSLFLNRLSQNPGDPAANFGAAFTMTYLYLNSMAEEIINFKNFIAGGCISNGFNFSVFTNTAVIDSITKFYKIAEMSNKYSFNIIMITGKQSIPYTINDSSDIMPVYITYSMVQNIKALSVDLLYKEKEIEEYFASVYNEKEKMFDLNLDPNKLDFSIVDSPLDLVLALERSNPDFLNFRPYGITKMKDTRASLRKSFSSFAELIGNAVNFIDALKLNNSDLPGNNSGNMISSFNNFVREVNMDFQVPDSTTVINGTVVNLSAWFDAPPANLLQKLQWYLDTDTTKDQTLGGLFPMANKGTGVLQDIPIPASYKLYQNFPNPFNPSTIISFDVPKSGLVNIKIYNILGREICTLINEEKRAGSYKIEFSANNSMIKLSSGIYFYRMQTGNYSETKKFVLLK